MVRSLTTWGPRTLTAVTGTAFVSLGILGFLLSLAHGQLEGWWDEALGPAWVATAIFAAALWLARRPGRLGILGDSIAILIAVAYLAAGQLADPITAWSFRHNVGFAAYIVLELLAAIAVLAATAWELLARIRNGGRLTAVVR